MGKGQNYDGGLEISEGKDFGSGMEKSKSKDFGGEKKIREIKIVALG